jgi:chemotaxis protein methyltransferase CheR
VLKKGAQGIYDEARVVNIPLKVKQTYFLKGKDENQRLVRVVPDLRKKLTFNRLNLMDASYNTPNDFDIIFCRNVLIYFDKATQEKVINKLCKKLKPGGIFFLGHSESITGISVPLQTIKPTIFRRK